MTNAIRRWKSDTGNSHVTRQSALSVVFAGAVLCAPPLVADTLAFWGFTDGAPGDTVSHVTSSKGLTVFTGTAGMSSANGALPTFSSDSPGRVIVSSHDATELCAAPQSIAFRYPSRSNRQSGLIDIAGIADELVGRGSFTIELFAKMDESYQYWVEGDGQWDQISKTVLYFQAEGNVGGFKLVTPKGVFKSGANAGHASGFGVQTYKRGDLESQLGNSGGDISDGKWHHLAVVYSETDAETQTGTIRFYVDYAKIAEMPYANTPSEETGLTLRLGTGYKAPPSDSDSAAGKTYSDKTSVEPIHASLACLRVSSGTLDVEDFEVVHEEGKAVFAIGFNKESVVTGTPIGSSVGTVDLPIYSDVGLSPTASFDYGLHKEAFPQYDTTKCRVNRCVLWGERKVWTNLAGCHFLGYASLAEGTANRVYAGTELCVAGSALPMQNPPSWTMESFVRVEYDSASGTDGNGALLFGKYAASHHTSGSSWPQYCWMLTRLPWTGKLRISWTENKESGVYTAEDKSYYKSAETAGDCLGDKKWHHVALSYHQPTRVFTLYLDSQPVLTAEVGETGLLDLPCGYYFSRMSPTSGFEGWMDEIRFTNGALTPDAFEMLDKAGLVITIR